MDLQLLHRLLIDTSWILIDAIEIAIAEGLFNIQVEGELLLLLRRIVQILNFM